MKATKPIQYIASFLMAVAGAAILFLGVRPSHIETASNDESQVVGESFDQEPPPTLRTNPTVPPSPSFIMDKTQKSVLKKTKKSIFDGAEVISQDETQPDADGKFQKWKVYRTHLQYPLVLVKEEWQKDPQNNNTEKMLAQSIMAADHVVIQLQPDASPDQLAYDLSKYQATVNPFSPDLQMYLVQFDGTDPHNVDNVLADIGENTAIKAADPDYLARGN